MSMDILTVQCVVYHRIKRHMCFFYSNMIGFNPGFICRNPGFIP